MAEVQNERIQTSSLSEEKDIYYLQLYEAFNEIDADQDGYITLEDLSHCCEDQLDDIMEALDLDKNGRISFEEFYACFKSVNPLLNCVAPQSPAETEVLSQGGRDLHTTNTIGGKTSCWGDDDDDDSSDSCDENSTHQKLFRVFSEMDKDSDGEPTYDELCQYCEGSRQLETTLDALDLDNTSLASSYVLETGGDDETAEWDCIMNKLSIDSQTPMFQSTELKDLINQMQFQSPHLLGILEKVISVLHDDWQECKLSCENLQTKLNSDAQHREELAVEYDEMLTEELEKERMTFVVKQHQLKTKLDKQLQEKEDNILQVISQKRTLERQLSVEKKERVILKKQNKELESTIKHMEDTISASQPPSLQRQRSIVDVLRVTSCTEFEPGAKKRQLLIRLLSQTSMDPLSRTTSLEFSQNDHCDTTTDQDKYSKHHDQDDIIDDADGDQDEYFDAVESTSDLSLPHTDHTSENISSIPSLAEEFEQEGHQYESMASVSGITQSTEDSPCHVYKVVYLGNNGVGKTSIIRWLLTGNFHSTVKSTQGVNYTTSKLSIDNENVLLELWDTAGQDEYGAITSVYCHNANAFVLVYDISSHGSFTTIRRWTDLIKIIRSVSTVLLLIGNKVDVSHCSRQVSTSEGEELSEELGATFIETSAKLGRNIMKAHEDLLRKLVEREQELVKPEIQGIILNPANPIDKRNFYCY